MKKKKFQLDFDNPSFDVTFEFVCQIVWYYSTASKTSTPNETEKGEEKNESCRTKFSLIPKKGTFEWYNSPQKKKIHTKKSFFPIEFK